MYRLLPEMRGTRLKPPSETVAWTTRLALISARKTSSFPSQSPHPVGLSSASHLDCQERYFPRLLISTRSFGLTPEQVPALVVFVIWVSAFSERSKRKIS